MPFEDVDRVASLLVEAYEQERSIFLFGNGGSAALASHFACDLGKGAANGSKKRFRVMALTDNVPLMTAWANDSKYEDIHHTPIDTIDQVDARNLAVGAATVAATAFAVADAPKRLAPRLDRDAVRRLLKKGE